MRVYVESAAVVGPAMTGQARDYAWLTSDARFDAGAARPEPTPEILDARERRRASPSVRLALAAADACVRPSTRRADSLPCVFGSAFSDGPLLGALLAVSSTPQARLSPTKFHNSVHNAALGYWTIAMHCTKGSTSIAAGDWTAGATLLRSVVQASNGDTPVLAVVYDTPFDPPLAASRPVGPGFAAGLLLDSRAGHSTCRLQVSLEGGRDLTASPPRNASLHGLWQSNPAARVLPLMEAIARSTLHAESEIVIEHAAGAWLRVQVTPC